MQFDRICFFGDSITLGANDSEKTGWPGRLTRGLLQDDRAVAIYNLGINGDTSEHIRNRWRGEFESRSRNAIGLLVFAFGFNDAAMANGSNVQVSLQNSVNNAECIFREAQSISELLWIGPTPLDESVNPMVTAHDSWQMFNQTLARYDQAYAELAVSLQIPYLQLFPQFLQSKRYLEALNSGDRVHPGDDGYQMIAERVEAWKPWQDIVG